MQYDVRALTAEHLVIELSVEASDKEEALRLVEARGLFATDVTPTRGLRANRMGRRRFSLVLFSQELLALLTAGLSIVEALEALLEKESGEGMRQTLSRLLQGLQDGKRFSHTLAEQPDLFPPIYIGIIQAAEGTSDLPQSLTRFIDYQQRIDHVRSKVISASIYPLILLLVGGGVTFFLIGYVVPRFAEVYQDAGRSLPWLSQLLLDWGRFAGAHTQSLLLCAALGVALLVMALYRFHGQGNMARVLGKLPGIGERVRIYELSRLYLTLGMLLDGGIPIVTALGTVHGIVSADIRTGLQASILSIEAGTPLSIAFEANGLTTPISLRMLRVGERSGELGQMLMQSATFYDGEISRWIDRFTRTFEPALMAAIGLVVGAIVVLLYMPIFDLAGSLS